MNMELAFSACQFCQKAPFKYTCPKCNALYCGNSCYRKPEHRKCTSSFYNVFNQYSSYSPGARNDIIMRYVALRNSLEIENKTIPDRAESESSMESESKSIWTNDDYVPPRMVINDSDSDDDSYPYYDYDYYSYDDDDDDDYYSNDDGDELNEADYSNNNDNDDRDDSNDNGNNHGDHSDSNDGRNHIVENSNVDSNGNGDGGNSIKECDGSNNNDYNDEFNLNGLEVD